MPHWQSEQTRSCVMRLVCVSADAEPEAPAAETPVAAPAAAAAGARTPVNKDINPSSMTVSAAGQQRAHCAAQFPQVVVRTISTNGSW